MSFKLLLAAGMTVAALTLPAGSVLAQDASSAQPPAGDAGTASSSAPASGDQAAAAAPASQNWLKICDPEKDGKRACIMRQVVVTQNKQFLGSFLLRDDPGQESRLLAVAAVPLGVLLPFGVTWQIDGGKPIRVPYMLCDPQSCATQLVVNEAYVNSLKKGSKLTLTAKNRKNEDLVITINLAGFTTVYDGDAALTFDEFNKNASGEAALEKILADRAEAARQKLAGGDASSSSSSAPAQ
ncbi:MAG TPA: invasion associated locus B family protein [Devosia sp.]|nr:invasion associated locus B family protein [Devosia sp.]